MENTIKLGNQNLTLHQIKVTIDNLSEQYEKSFEKNPNGDLRILEQMKKYQHARKQLLKYDVVKQRANKIESKSEEQNINTIAKTKESINEKSASSEFKKVTATTSNKENVSKNKEQKERILPLSYTNNDLVIDTMRFNGKTGKWIIEYHENAMTNVEEFSIDSKYLSECNQVYREMRKKYGKKHLNSINIDKYNILSHFDKEHGTNFGRKYLEGDCDYLSTYNLRKLFSNKNYTLKDKSQILISANKQKKRKNTEVLNPKYGKLVLTTFCLSILLASASVTNLTLKKTKKINVKGISITSESSSKDLEKTNPVKEDINKIDSNKFENIEEISTENINDKSSDKNETINTTKENCLKIKDKYELKNVELLYSSVKDVRSVNTDDLNCDYYEACLIAVVDPDKIDQDENNNGILDVKTIDEVEDSDLDSLVENYRNEYCNDKLRVVVNFNGYDELGNIKYKEIGWTEISNIKNAKVKNEKTSTPMSYMEQKNREYNAVIAARTPKVLKKMR